MTSSPVDATVRYIEAQDVADYFQTGITLTSTTDPTVNQVNKFIDFAMAEIERRTNRAWREMRFDQLVRDVPRTYHFTRGFPIFLPHTDVRALSSADGDKFEVWDGSEYKDMLADGSLTYEELPKLGKIYIRGYAWSWLRFDRFKITYRYGSVITDDVKEMCTKLACVKWLERSFNLDIIQFGGAISPQDAIKRWKEDVSKWIGEVAELVVVEY